ncbi:MAG: RagB/SusD family nutrient uptake outer membrane protein [Dysgonamonadaceae bacterium]|jgi:hypothetical protein|nr:RagB/SusD family nutrient uptake outer membrane protein [Dysgonamonadaceae bacterium]
MRTIKYLLIITLISFLTVSCVVDTDLQEVPKDFQSPENSFVNKAGFESALADIYRTVRTDMYMPSDNVNNFSMLGIDIDFTAMRGDDISGVPQYNEMWFWNTFNKDNSFVGNWWQRYYNWIFKANVIIDRAEDENVNWTSEEEKNQIVGEAKFLRAFAYHFLANCWGDVPLVLNETNAPKFDYTRVPVQEVYQQCKADLTDAVKWMITVDKQPGGRAPRAAAYHLLSEVNICLGDYQGAIDAASAVINDPNFSLMTERFGVRTDFTFNGYDYQGPQEPWGDVYWDLYQEGNMNWSEGNREAIWNIEMDVKILGGGNVTEWGGNFGLERHWCPNWWSAADKNGLSNWLKDTLCGRPVGSTYASDYTGELIWQYKGDWDRDIRNSQYNIQREMYWTNPNGEFYGQRMLPEHLGVPASYRKYTAPSFKKATTTVHYGLYQDAASGQNQDQGRVFKDWYIMRMPETYLLRAEAYLRSGNQQKAADDINVVRSRAHATPVNSSDVDIDLILDERARELYIEEFRTSTLMRMEKLVEYLMKYNGAVKQNGYQIPAYKNKFPIPQSEIEANKGAVLVQNPGYE